MPNEKQQAQVENVSAKPEKKHKKSLSNLMNVHL